jgi:transcriptional regulator with XRE-family HTH domain
VAVWLRQERSSDDLNGLRDARGLATRFFEARTARERHSEAAGTAELGRAGKREVTADTALRLAAALGTTAQFWMNLQKSYELRVEELDKEHAADRRRIRRLVSV